MAQQLSTYYLKGAIKEFGDEFVKELVRQIIQADKKATGNLIKSLNYKLVEASNEIILQILSADYLKYVDEGRKPGKMPPVKKIIKWAEVRKISYKPKYKTIDQLGWAIAKSIEKKGIKPTNVIQKAKDKLLSNKSKIDKISRAGLLDVNELINKTLGNLSTTGTK